MKNTYEALDFMCALANAIGDSLEDGKIGVADLVNLYAPMSKIQLALEDIAEIRTELQESSADDLKKIEAYVLERFDIPQDKIEVFVEGLMGGAMALVGAVRSLKKK
jgi:hypothetical protein